MISPRVRPAVVGFVVCVLLLGLGAPTAQAADNSAQPAAAAHWQWCGWGGGGYMWAAAYHPTRAGVIYMGGDVAGVYKTEDDGLHWRTINEGLVDYAVYGLAVDPKSPDTVYAVTESGTCKSTDAGEHWTYLPETARDKLGIFAARHVSVRPVAVDPADGNTVYAATPAGRIYKSTDGARTWAEVYRLAADVAPAASNGSKAEGKRPAFAGISVSQADPRLVLAASPQAGAFVSRDGGRTWEHLDAPATAQCVVTDPASAAVLYGAFGAAGVHKSTDGGKTWSPINTGIRKGVSIREVAVSPADSSRLVCIGSIDWNGFAYWSDDAGRTWNPCPRLTSDPSANPTFGMPALSAPTNVTYCPGDPNKLFVSSNWRPVFSGDGGRTWTERDRGADISCVYDVRFSPGGRVYAACMDEGVLYSDDNGGQWHQAWPRANGDRKIAGHYWRLAISPGERGADRVVSTCSPWDADGHNRVVLSEDGARTFKVVAGAGLPDYTPRANTMWGQGYARALAADPKAPKTLYLGIDGDPEGDKPGGGVFKSTDGGYTWARLAHQPGSRRMFFGLAVDPTDSRRLYWGACGAGGGLYRSDDGGESWRPVFTNETWVFNVLVAADGTVYAPGRDLWRSTDHGATWKRLTHMTEGQIVGLEVHPRDPKAIWFSTIKHGGTNWGHVMKSTDGGVSWQEIAGDIGYRKPMVLRFNPATDELWAGGVGLFRIKQ